MSLDLQSHKQPLSDPEGFIVALAREREQIKTLIKVKIYHLTTCLKGKGRAYF
jgi:hypothetical protein